MLITCVKLVLKFFEAEIEKRNNCGIMSPCQEHTSRKKEKEQNQPDFGQRVLGRLGIAEERDERSFLQFK